MGRRTLAMLMLVTGVVVSIVGVTAVWLYVSEGLIASLGRPDKSYIFWLIPVAFIGVGAIVAGVVLVWGGRRLCQSNGPGDEAS